ncbi:hypothetical protein [Myxococcus eversor]|uniref:hypothetical protein n=1 Tax=Myxococcus eversor TaxID=2709661 RepID=UPI0013D42A95|nr:hypothetical protein [Myxococcus eversor]
MNVAIKTIAVVGVVGLGFSTTTVRAEATLSREASPVSGVIREASWTWTDFGGQAIGWAAGGAAGGAVSAAMVGSPVGAACGGAVGAVAGAASGAAYYAGTQAWNYMMGDSAEAFASFVPATALD